MTAINLDTLETDTSGWQDYCLGYHSIKVPPGLSASTHPSTNIDWHYPEVIRDYADSARTYVESHSRYGGTVFQAQVNGWDFIVAKERRSAIRVSTRSLVFFGARKVGDDIVVFTEDAAISLVGNGSDEKYRAFYKNLTVTPVTLGNGKDHFCHDGYAFSGYTPQHVYTFTADFLSPVRHGYTVSLSQTMNKPAKSNRPLAPQSDPIIPESLQITESLLTKSGYRGVISRVLGVDDEAEQGYLKILIEGPYGDLANPIISSGTISEIKAGMKEKEHEFLSFIANMKANQGGGDD